MKRAAEDGVDEIVKKMKRVQILDYGSATKPKLPDDLIFEVLGGLQIKELFKSKCVSKGWRSIISQPQFIEAYSNRNPSVVVLSIHHSNDNDLFEGDEVFSWMEHTIVLPSELRRNIECTITVGNLPSGEILLTNSRAADTFTPIYSYNHENNNKYKRFLVGKLPDLKYGEDYLVAISCSQQNIGMFDALLCGG